MALAAGQIMMNGEKIALSAITRQAQSAAAGAIWLALLTAAPPSAADATMAAETEYMGGAASGYARQVYGPAAPTTASPAVISNSGVITWGPFTAGITGTVTWAMLTDAVSGTTALNLVAYLLASPRTPALGDSLQAAIASFTVQV